ncbi:MAG TPA: hypothetical protein ENJ82_14755 [Bacteroidetes bacterium]|nr:hypothetical protein [Bacteroidota bacterium]
MFHIAQGVTDPITNAADWNDYLPATNTQPAGIRIDVDTSNCGFTSTPQYLISIEGVLGYHWYLSGQNSIYNATPTGFTVYLRWTDAPSDFPTIGVTNEPNSLRVATAVAKRWSMKWTGISTCPCSAASPKQGK